MNVSAASLAPDSSVRKATPSDITERTARSGAVVETIFLSRPRRAQCTFHIGNDYRSPFNGNSFYCYIYFFLCYRYLKFHNLPVLHWSQIGLTRASALTRGRGVTAYLRVHCVTRGLWGPTPPEKFTLHCIPFCRLLLKSITLSLC